MTAAARRAARASWKIEVTRPGGGSDAGDEQLRDDLFRLDVPQDERARLTWHLSRELYELAAPLNAVRVLDATFALLARRAFVRSDVGARVQSPMAEEGSAGAGRMIVDAREPEDR